MQNFLNTSETRTLLFINAFSIFMTAPLKNTSINKKYILFHNFSNQIHNFANKK